MRVVNRMLEDLMTALSPIRRARVEARTAELIAEGKNAYARTARKSHTAFAQTDSTRHVRRGRDKR